MDTHRIVQIWRDIHKPFVIPSPCKTHQWQLIDCDMAGCLLCGHVHICHDKSKDCLKICENDCTVCGITGFVIRDVQFAEIEYLDTLNFQSQNHDKYQNENNNIIEYDTILEIVNKFVLSDLTQKSFEQEQIKIILKSRSHIFSYLKQWKIKNANSIPSLINVITNYLNQNVDTRSLYYDYFDHDQKVAIAKKCASSITHIINILTSSKLHNIGKVKQPGLIIGILYLLKNGVTYRGVIILPKIRGLEYILPMESHLACYFGIRCKTITEVENIVKLFVRNSNLQKFVSKGTFDRTDIIQ